MGNLAKRAMVLALMPTWTTDGLVVPSASPPCLATCPARHPPSCLSLLATTRKLITPFTQTEEGPVAWKKPQAERMRVPAPIVRLVTWTSGVLRWPRSLVCYDRLLSGLKAGDEEEILLKHPAATANESFGFLTRTMIRTIVTDGWANKMMVEKRGSCLPSSKAPVVLAAKRPASSALSKLKVGNEVVISKRSTTATVKLTRSRARAVLARKPRWKNGYDAMEDLFDC